jgi:hypothetical protein
MEKVDEHNFLFGVEVSADHQHLVVRAVEVERDFVRAFCWLEATHMVLRFWILRGEGLEPRGELAGALDSFLVFEALNVAFVCMLVRGVDGDAPLGPGIFSFR